MIGRRGRFACFGRGTRAQTRRGQRGFTLVVGLLMLALVTLVVVAGYNLGSSNLKVVFNMQTRDEAIAAAQLAAAQVISDPSGLAARTGSETICVNVDSNASGLNCAGTADYSVNVSRPTCVAAVQASQAAPSDVELGVGMSTSASWNTDWEIRATATDSNTGVVAKLVQGVRVRLTEAEKQLRCP